MSWLDTKLEEIETERKQLIFRKYFAIIGFIGLILFLSFLYLIMESLQKILSDPEKSFRDLIDVKINTPDGISIFFVILLLIPIILFIVKTISRANYLINTMDSLVNVLANLDSKTTSIWQRSSIKKGKKFFDNILCSLAVTSNGTNNEIYDSVYSEYTDLDMKEYDDYAEMIHSSLIWIIRLGIIGTLFGLMISFKEMSLGVAVIKENEFEFQNYIIKSLKGSSLAIITSLAAHFVSLLIEMIISQLFKMKNNLSNIRELIDYKRTENLKLPSLTDEQKRISEEITENLSDAKEKTEELNTSLMTIKDEKIPKLDADISQSLNLSILISQSLSSLVNSTTNIGSKLSEILVSVTELQNNLKKFVIDKFDKLSEIIDQIKITYENLVNFDELIKRFIKETGEIILNISSIFRSLLDEMETWILRSKTIIEKLKLKMSKNV